MGKISNIIIHESASSFGSVNLIRKWHLEKGWRDIGYHFVILNGEILKGFFLPSMNGSIDIGRDIDGDNMLVENEVGAHAYGYNANSIGMCLIGDKGLFTHKQLDAMVMLCEDLIAQYGIRIENILGHNETEHARLIGKTCPGFDANYLRQTLRFRVLTSQTPPAI